MGPHQDDLVTKTAMLSDRRAPILATPRSMGAIVAGFYASGALAAAVVTGVHPTSGSESAARVGLLGVAFVVALGVYLRRERLGPVAYKWMNVGGTSMVTALMFLGPKSAGAASFGLIDAYAPLYSYFFLPVRNAVRYQAFAVACIIGVTVSGRLGYAEAFVLLVASAVLACVLVWLLRSISTAETDDLTGLPNRAGLERLLRMSLDTATRREEPVALALIDIDRFDNVNRRIGQRAADQLLARAGANLARGLPRRAVAARYSGSGFALVISGSGSTEAEQLVESLRGSFADNYPCSAGLTEFSPGDSVTMLMGRARGALADAKRAGRNHLAVRSSEHSQADELATAVLGGQLRVLFQPIVSLPSGDLLGAEALVRWEHPERGLVPPDKFIPLAEETGIVVDLGREVLRMAVAGMGSWPWSLKVTVNASGAELERPEYASEVLHAISGAGFSATRLVIEVTESRLEQDSGTMLANLQQLRRYGVRVALDDFGTGYSSLHRLASLPIDYVKIDRSFVSAIDDETTEAPIIAAVCTLARATGLVVVAEGIETPHQARVLFDHGCAQGQGYHYGRPGPLERLLEMKGGRQRRVFTPGGLAAIRDMGQQRLGAGEAHAGGTLL